MQRAVGRVLSSLCLFALVLGIIRQAVSSALGFTSSHGSKHAQFWSVKTVCPTITRARVRNTRRTRPRSCVHAHQHHTTHDPRHTQFRKPLSIRALNLFGAWLVRHGWLSSRLPPIASLKVRDPKHRYTRAILARTRTRTHPHTHARTPARTHTHTHAHIRARTGERDGQGRRETV